MKRYVLVVFLFACSLLSCPVFAQQNETAPTINLPEKYGQESVTDSLYAVLKTAKEDTNKVNTLNKLAWQILSIGNYPKADSLSRSALHLAEQLNFKKGQANAYNNMGDIYFYRGDYPNALKNHFAALKIREEIGDMNGIAISYNNIGNAYSDQGEYSTSLKNHFAALKIYEEVGNKRGIATSYNNIGYVYYVKGDLSNALKNYSTALKINEEIGFKQGIGNAYANIGNIFHEQGDYTNALKNYLLSLKINKELDAKFFISINYQNLGDLFIQQKEYSKAREYLDSGLILSKNIGDKGVIKDTYGTWVKLDSATGNYKAAYHDYEMYVAYRISLENEENTKKLLSEQLNYEFDEKMAAEKSRQEKADIIRTAENKRKSITIYSMIVILALTLIAAVLFINSQRIKRKKDKIEKAMLTIEKLRVEEELLNAQKVLEDHTRSMSEKNELLEQFKTDIEKLKNLKSKELDEMRIEQLEHLNKTTILTEEDWDKFKDLFEQVYKGFLIRLKEKLPHLSQAETRLICLIKLKLDNKQMASILGVSFGAIRITRHRLRKKLGLSENKDMEDIVESI